MIKNIKSWSEKFLIDQAKIKIQREYKSLMKRFEGVYPGKKFNRES